MYLSEIHVYGGECLQRPKEVSDALELVVSHPMCALLGKKLWKRMRVLDLWVITMAPPKTCIPLRKHFKRPQENQITIPYISVAGNIEQLLGTLFKENQVENQL